MITIHPSHPQQRLIERVAAIVQSDGVIIYPTDSAYAIGCQLDNNEGVERIRRIRNLDKRHNFTLMCRDLSELSVFAKVDNVIFRMLKAHTPGPYTFVMLATKGVPKRLQNIKRKTIGLRIPDHPVTQALLNTLDKPLLSLTMTMPGKLLPIANAEDVPESLEQQVDMVIDAGHCGIEPTTVIDLTGNIPEILRQGKGDASIF